MKAIILRELGAAENLKLEEAPDPKPGAGEAVVRLKAASLNHRDVFIWQKLYPGIKLPAILGSDGAGVVDAVGDGVDQSLIGQEVVVEPGLDWGPSEEAPDGNYRILGMPEDGTYAEMIKIPAANLHPKPAHLTFEEAAALPLAGLTAYRAVVTRAKVKAGEAALVTGIGGGVAIFAAQIAERLGARVFVTSGSDDKLARSRELGVEGGANYKNPDWGKTITEMTGGGPNVVIDSAGGESMETAIKIIKPAGRIAFYGATTGLAKIDLFRVFFKQLSLLGSTMGSPREFAAFLKLYCEAKLRPVIDSVFPLAEAAAAHRRMNESEQFGKIVLKIE
ncbi:MAG TPA: zinc-binding dehydrogenase [Blastocatellia bacterium]|jgi:NADPH:quinone reductase-like Zn-dependent oxidoreductase